MIWKFDSQIPVAATKNAQDVRKNWIWKWIKSTIRSFFYSIRFISFTWKFWISECVVDAHVEKKLRLLKNIILWNLGMFCQQKMSTFDFKFTFTKTNAISIYTISTLTRSNTVFFTTNFDRYAWVWLWNTTTLRTWLKTYFEWIACIRWWTAADWLASG